MNAHVPLPIEDLLEKLRAAASQPFESANPIPAQLNHSPEFFEREKQKIFAAEWICIGREDEIPNHGDYLTHEVAGVPVFAVRQKDGEVAAFINACAHRFACLLPDEKGSAKRFTCRYHGWTYDNSGALVAAPHMKMKDGFDLSEHKLRAIEFEIWEGFLYVTLAEKPSTRLADVLAPIKDNVVGRFDMACYKTVLRETMVWKANWKNLIENFTESYHVPIAHGKTFAQHDKPLEDYIVSEDSDYYGYHRAVQEADAGLGAAHPENKRLEGEWRRMMVDFCVFPCHLVTLLPDYLWYITVQPHGIDHMKATWAVAVPPEVLQDAKAGDYDKWLAGFKTFIDTANGEDKTLVEALHAGSRSPHLPQGTYHPIEKNLWQFNRYLARVCG